MINPDPFNPGFGPTTYFRPKIEYDPNKRERTRIKIQKANAKIKQKIQMENARTRQEMKDEFNRLLAEKEKFSRALAEKTAKRLLNSPFRIDLEAQFLKRKEEYIHFMQRKAEKMNCKMIVANMTGKPTFDLVTPDDLKRSKAPPEQKLALELRSTLKDLAVTYQEEERLRNFQEQEYEYILKSFPAVAVEEERINSLFGSRAKTALPAIVRKQKSKDDNKIPQSAPS